MTGKQWLLLLVLADFTAFTVWAAVDAGGMVGFYEHVFSSLATTQVLIDIGIAAFLILIWMVRDARARGATVWPYVAVTLFAGSIGPLLYLFVRETAKQRQTRPLRPAEAAA